jgi:hypothetical protein
MAPSTIAILFAPMRVQLIVRNAARIAVRANTFMAARRSLSRVSSRADAATGGLETGRPLRPRLSGGRARVGAARFSLVVSLENVGRFLKSRNLFP